MNNLEKHADKLLTVYCESFCRHWGYGDFLPYWEACRKAEGQPQKYDLESALRELYDECDLHIGDGMGFAMLRFYIWQRTTNKRLKATLALKIAQSGFATKYMKETVLGVPEE